VEVRFILHTFTRKRKKNERSVGEKKEISEKNKRNGRIKHNSTAGVEPTT